MIERIVITPQPDRMDVQVFGVLSMLLGNTPGTDGELPESISGCGGSIYSSTYHKRTPKGRVDDLISYRWPSPSPHARTSARLLPPRAAGAEEIPHLRHAA